MNCLLDTHAFLWAVISPDKLSRKAKSAITDPANNVCLSSITFWGISLKFAIGKLELSGCVPEDLVAAAQVMDLSLIYPSAEESASFHRLPRSPHRDPFDRMLVWQAIQRGLTLISRDSELPPYRDAGLKTLW